MTSAKRIFLLLTITVISLGAWAQVSPGTISGKVISTDGETIDYATVYLKGTSYSCYTDDKGIYHLNSPAGNYTLTVSAVGFEKFETNVNVEAGKRTKLNIKLNPSSQLAEVIVVGSQLSKVKTRHSTQQLSIHRSLSIQQKLLARLCPRLPA